MEQKINNQKIFRYVPALIARIIINSNLQDKDIFSDGKNDENKNLHYSLGQKSTKIKNTFLTTSFINTNIYPISYPIQNTLVMNIRLKGFQKLISTLSIKDPKDQKEKIVSEYLSIITPKILLKISKIISKNGGEIIKYNDYEFTTIWNFTPKKRLLKRYQKFYTKQAILTACQIMKEVDKTEITSGIKIKISIGVAMGETLIVFFGGERKRGEYIVMGETLQRAEICLNYCLNHEVIISKEVNDLFIGSEEIFTKKVNNEENFNLYLITNFREDLLDNFRGFKIKMRYDKLKLTKTVYENLSNKVYIFSSILPQGLVKYLDVGQDENLKEISVVTIATIHIMLNQKLINDLTQIQNIILDIQKATYLTFGSLLYISKTYNGLLVRCVWGMDPGSFLDDTARSIKTATLIGSLTEHYEIKIGIGIATGSCYIGLIPLQGDRKQFTLLGKKVNLSRTLADEAFQKVMDKTSTRKYCIYCDNITMKHSQKWYRHLYISQMKIYFNKDSQELYYETKEDYTSGSHKNSRNSTENYDPKYQLNETIEAIKKYKSNFINFSKISRNNTSLFGEYNRQSTIYFKNCSNLNDNLNEKTHLIVREIFSPIECEEYFLPTLYDIFPLIRTHKNNSYSSKIRQCFYNHFQYNSESKINLKGISNLPVPIKCSQSDENKLEDKYLKSNVIFGREKDLQKMVNIMNTVTKKNRKQIILIKGPLGVGKSLFLRKSLNQYLDDNEGLKDIHLNSDQFIFCNKIDPLIATFPYNTFCFTFRNLFLHLKRLDLLKELYEETEKLNLDEENIKSINFVLSMGKKDINIEVDFDKISKEMGEKDNKLSKSLKNTKRYFSNVNVTHLKTNHFSVISELEGPYKIKDSNKINIFFYKLIKIYKNYLNKKYNKKSSHLLKPKNKLPIILVVDDVHISEKNSIDFIRYLFNDEEKYNNPFIIILVEQTPFDKNYAPLTHRELEFFLSAFSEFDEKLGKDKIICFDIKPFFEKDILQDIIIESFSKYIIKNYDTELMKIDDKVLDFLLMKSFQGNPLLSIALFESLLKSQKYLKIIECTSECAITKDLLDDNEVFDWSNLTIPYVYEKISSMMINNLLNFKETLLLKYACTIGTIFDIQTLDKINPLNLLIKREDLYQIIKKLCDEYVVEIFDDENIMRKSKKFLICKICFPFMREVLNQKFPVERSASLHAETAKLLTGGKKMYFFDHKVEGKILKRHLIYSEIDVLQEVESKIGVNIPEKYKKRKIMNSDNLTLLFVKDFCGRIFDRKFKNVLEGNLEVKIESRWEKVSYFIDRSWKIHFSMKININNNEDEIEIIIPIKDIYKNTRLNDGKTLELIIAEYSVYIQNTEKEKVYFQSEEWIEIFNFDTAITFLKVVANYNKYLYNFGYTQFPLYKPGYYIRKEKKYYANIEKNQLSYFDNLNPNKRKRLLSCFGLENRTERIISESKDLKKPFMVLMQTAFTLILAKIQSNLGKNKNELEEEDEESHRLIQGKIVYLMYIPTSPHVDKPINKYLEEFAQKEKEEEELQKMRKKNKFTFLPLSLLKEERRVLGGRVETKRKHQSISEIKPSLYTKEESKEKKDKKGQKHISFKEFPGRKNAKSKTIKEVNEIPKEVKDKFKCDTSIEFFDKSDNESGKETSEIKSSENEENQSATESESSQKSESPIKDIDLRYSVNFNGIFKSKNKLKDKIKTFKEKMNDSNENRSSINSNSKDNNLDNVLSDDNDNDNDNYCKNNFNLKNLIKKNTNDKNVNKKNNINKENNYNINNYINNNININVIGNNYLKNSFIKNNLLKNYYNSNEVVNMKNLRMSYQKELSKFRSKSNSAILYMKKYNSDRLRSIKEKYLNNINNYYHSNSSNKISFDEKEEDLFSDKESENNDSNNNDNNIFIITSPQQKKKKNSKASAGALFKDDIFVKIVFAILGEDNKEIESPIKDDSSTGWKKIKKKKDNFKEIIENNNSNENDLKKYPFRTQKSFNMDEPKKFQVNDVHVKKKRSSFMTPYKFNFNKKHVKFYNDKNEINEEDSPRDSDTSKKSQKK